MDSIDSHATDRVVAVMTSWLANSPQTPAPSRMKSVTLCAGLSVTV